jgi:hypothetical protein|tara:strand:- start:9444 stop:10052 length:609 start_codon:yes stop_codon:yes gene_type:complete
MSIRTKLIFSILTFSLISCFSLYRLDQLNSIPIAPSNFSWINKAEIYTLGLAIGAIGYPLYPEVAREHLMMYRPFSDKPKVIKSTFFRGSPVVERAIQKSKKSGKPYRLAWPSSTYRLSFNPDEYKEARIALALNGGYIRVEGDNVIATINIKYPKKSFAPLIPIKGLGTIGVEEGLFWVLQKEGWLHSGIVEWHTSNPQLK